MKRDQDHAPDPLSPSSLETHPVSFRMPRWLIDLLAELRQRLAHKHPLNRPPSRVEVLALALRGLSQRTPTARGGPPKKPNEEVPPILTIPVGFEVDEVVWSSADRRNLARRRYLVTGIQPQKTGQSPKVFGRKLDANGEPFGPPVKMPPGRYERAPSGNIPGVEESLVGPRFYAKHVPGMDLWQWQVFERFNERDEIGRGWRYPTREMAERAVPFVAKGEYLRPDDPRLAEGADETEEGESG